MTTHLSALRAGDHRQWQCKQDHITPLLKSPGELPEHHRVHEAQAPRLLPASPADFPTCSPTLPTQQHPTLISPRISRPLAPSMPLFTPPPPPGMPFPLFVSLCLLILEDWAKISASRNLLWPPHPYPRVSEVCAHSSVTALPHPSLSPPLDWGPPEEGTA